VTRPLDAPVPVRPGEELDIERLSAHLQAHLEGFAGPLTVSQYPGGHSNLTYLVRAGSSEMVLRRPPFGSRVKSAHDMGREYRMLSALHRSWGKVPRPLLWCEDETVLGAPFYLMEKVEGVILRAPRKPRGLDLAPDAMRIVSQALVDTLAELHRVDLAAAGLAGEGRPQGFAKRQVEGWTERYDRARTDDVAEAEAAARWLAVHVPEDGPPAVVHGDYKYDNLVLDAPDPGRVLAVLDWEMATVGDPLLDLGTTLAYWVDPDDPPELRALPLGPTQLAGNLSRREVVARYAAASGREVRDPLFAYVLGLFKVLVIAQQIYRRFAEGHTRDPRFAAMIDGVRILGRTAVRAIDRGRIDRLG